MNFVAAFEMDNATFDEAEGADEAARILRGLAEQLEDKGTADFLTGPAVRIIDAKGHSIGTARVIQGTNDAK